MKKKKKGLNPGAIIGITMAVVLVFAGVVILIVLLGKGGREKTEMLTPEPEQAGSREVMGSARAVLDEATAASVVDEMRQEVEEGMFACNMAMTWTFEDGKSISEDAYVENSVSNTHPIFFDVYLMDTEDLLYTSPVLPVGTRLTDIALDKDLDPGSYEATVMYTLLKDTESQEEISSAGFIITINVLH